MNEYACREHWTRLLTAQTFIFNWIQVHNSLYQNMEYSKRFPVRVVQLCNQNITSKFLHCNLWESIKMFTYVTYLNTISQISYRLKLKSINKQLCFLKIVTPLRWKYFVLQQIRGHMISQIWTEVISDATRLPPAEMISMPIITDNYTCVI